MAKHLNLIERDAWTLELNPDGSHSDGSNSNGGGEGWGGGEGEAFLDMLWVDFGAGQRLDDFFEKWWPKV